MRSENGLGERGAVIVDYVARYRVMTLDLLSLFFPKENPDALRMLLSRLATAGWLCRFPMGPREHYYILGPRAIRNIELPGNRPHRKAQGFSQPGLLQHMAIGYLCVRHGLLRLRPDEFMKFLPDHTRPGLPAQNYMLRVDGGDPVLYWAIPDHATPAKVFPKKVGKVFATRFALPAFQARILSGGLAVAIVTGNEQKARQIEDALAESDSQFTNAGVLVIPEIEPLQMM
jgi:hypothetical protein